MGSGESKPNDVSDKAWLEQKELQRQEKVRQLEQERVNAVRLENERLELVAKSTLLANTYMTHCQDVPKPLFLFPGYRRQCEASRLAAMNHAIDLLQNSWRTDAHKAIVEQIQKEFV